MTLEKNQLKMSSLKTRNCTACNGSGYYDVGGSPKCSSCNGTGKETYDAYKDFHLTFPKYESLNIVEVIRQILFELDKENIRQYCEKLVQQYHVYIKEAKKTKNKKAQKLFLKAAKDQAVQGLMLSDVMEHQNLKTHMRNYIIGAYRFHLEKIK